MYLRDFKKGQATTKPFAIVLQHLLLTQFQSCTFLFPNTTIIFYRMLTQLVVSFFYKAQQKKKLFQNYLLRVFLHHQGAIWWNIHNYSYQKNWIFINGRSNLHPIFSGSTKNKIRWDGFISIQVFFPPYTDTLVFLEAIINEMIR